MSHFLCLNAYLHSHADICTNIRRSNAVRRDSLLNCFSKIFLLFRSFFSLFVEKWIENDISEVVENAAVNWTFWHRPMWISFVQMFSSHLQLFSNANWVVISLVNFNTIKLNRMSWKYSAPNENRCKKRKHYFEITPITNRQRKTLAAISFNFPSCAFHFCRNRRVPQSKSRVVGNCAKCEKERCEDWKLKSIDSKPNAAKR